MDTAQWPQEMVVKPMDEIITNQSSKSSSLERKIKPQRDQVVNCPRCNSTNTKFCYYNNYSLSQPRYFCKTCRRYWTAGGSLRNIPVGGGSRKNKRSSSSSSTSNASSSSSSKRVHDHLGNNGGFIGGGSITTAAHVCPQLSQNPKNNINGGQDLNLCFPPPPPPPPPPSSNDHFKTFTELIQVPNYDNHNTNNKENNPSSSSASASATATASSQLSAMELLTGISSRGLNSFMPMPSIVDPNAIYSSGFSLSEPKNSLNFSLDGLGNGGLFGGLQSVQDQTSNGRLFFPFEDLKQVSNTTNVTNTDAQQNMDQNADSTGYWNGVLGGGTW